MRHYLYQGEDYTISQLAKLAADKFNNPVKEQTIYARINRDGWDVDKAVRTPLKIVSLDQLTPEERRKRLTEQQRNYFKKHRQTFYRSNYLAMVKSYLRRYATVDDLQTALSKVKARKAELKSEEANANA